MLALLAALAVALPQSETPRVPARVTSVALFKNGYGWVQREARVPSGASVVEIELPVPSLGTFSVAHAPALATVTSAIARRRSAPSDEPVGSVQELLQRNTGREVELLLEGGEILSGVLRPVRAPEKGQVAWSYSPQIWPSDLVVLATDAGTVALRASAVKLVRAPLLESRGTREVAVLELRFERPLAAEMPVILTGLERGWSWMPSYALEVGQDRGRLAARAEVLAEADALDAATVRFVTGFPNLRHAHVVDPVALHGGLDEFLHSLGQTPEEAGPMTRQMVNFQNTTMAPGAVPGRLPAELAGVEAGDLFVSEPRTVTLGRGERALVPLFDADVPLEHVYQWKIVVDPRARVDADRPDGFWHSVRLSNATAQPWTTGPITLTRDGFLLGQDVLSYAAAGASTTVPVTRAIDLFGKRRTTESARERDRWHNGLRDLVTLHEELRVTSYEREPVTLEVVRDLTGEVVAVPADALHEILGDRPESVNRRERLTWTLTLGAGESRTLEFDFRYYTE